jgi:hypothetical protein
MVVFYFLAGIIAAVTGLFFYIRNNRAQFEKIFGDVDKEVAKVKQAVADEVAKLKAEIEKLKANLPK